MMEKTMSKTNDTSTPGPATQVRELRDDELQQVSGGSISEMNQMDMLVRGRTGVGGRGICPFPDVC
jgi:bacteriocin-like protein